MFVCTTICFSAFASNMFVVQEGNGLRLSLVLANVRITRTTVILGETDQSPRFRSSDLQLEIRKKSSLLPADPFASDDPSG